MLMWSFYGVINKFLNREEEEEGEREGEGEGGHGSERGHTSLVGAFSFVEKLTATSCRQGSMVSSSQWAEEVPHIGQLYSWDCGLACVSMVLRTLGIEHHDIHVLADICNTKSIWTVDLAYLLQKFSVRFAFFTVTLGANPNFSMETFYKDQLPSDVVRVDKLFQKAVEAGINIQRRSFNGEELSMLISSGKYIAIALVDQYKLSRSWPADVCASGLYGGTSGYTGHYVVICGYDRVENEFEIRDPASSRRHVKISLNCLEEARKSFGTDEDLLLISLEKKQIV